jgi:hypothetical protein
MNPASSTMDLAHVWPSKPLSVPEPWWLIVVGVFIVWFFRLKARSGKVWHG